MTEETLIACPNCNAWPMPLNAKSDHVEYVCKSCGHREARTIKHLLPHTEPA
jgi:DNA-directed RNA polymerase subunit RPC12/RpoP